MENEPNSKDTSTSSFSGSSSRGKKSSVAGFQYMRKVSTSFIRKPKKTVPNTLITRENRKSISVDDVVSFKEEDGETNLPKFSLKVRSLPRDGQIPSNLTYSESISPARSDVMPLGASAFSSNEHIISNKRRSYSITNDHISYINSETFNNDAKEAQEQKEKEAKEMSAMREDLAQCKKDFETLKTNFEQFKEEFRDGIDNLNALVKEDENRYTRLCYRLSNVTDLHQTQLQYLHSVIDNMEEDNDRRKDDVLLDMLCEKLSTLETRITKL